MNPTCVIIKQKAIRYGLIPVLFWILSLLPLFLQAEVTVYPAPSGAPVNTTFTVQVRPAGGAWADLTAYDAVVDKATQSHMSFVYFDSDFSESVEVMVVKNSGTIGSVKVRPDSASITPTVSGNTITFTMTTAKKVSVEVDNDIFHNLFIFANPMETDPITASAPGIYYYGPGINYIGDGTGTLTLVSGDTVYIAGGAIVYGNIHADTADGITIRGRGILSGSQFNHNLPDNADKPILISLLLVTNSSVKDIILLDTVGWHIWPYGCDGMTFDNLKMISWTVNSDGIDPQVSSNVLINDVFIRNNDDVVSVKLAYYLDNTNPLGSHNVTLQNSTLWSDQGGAAHVGPESFSTTDQTYDGITIKNIDVLRVNNYDIDWARGVLSVIVGDGATARNITYQDIRVDSISSTTNLINVRVGQTPFNASPGYLMQNVSFNNISLKGPNQKANVIYGYDAGRVVDGVHFTDLQINNICVGSTSAGGFLTNAYTRNITFACSPGPNTPAIVLNPTSLAFSATQGGGNPASKTLGISNGSGGTLTWTATADRTSPAWLSVSPASGTGARTLTVSVNISGLAAGTYTKSITIAATGASNTPQTVTVTLIIAPPPPPAIVLSPTSLAFSAIQGGSNPASKTLGISNGGAGTLAWTATADATAPAWLSVSPASGTGARTLTVSANISSLAAGTYTKSITIAATGASNTPQTVTVTLTIATPPPPAIVLSPTSLAFSAIQGGSNPASKTLGISNGGAGTLAWTATADATAPAWLSVSPASGTGARTLTVSANISSLAAGTYTKSITIAATGASNTPQTVYRPYSLTRTRTRPSGI